LTDSRRRPQRPRQAKPGENVVEQLGCRLAGRAGRGADLRLAIGIDHGVERQHGRPRNSQETAPRSPHLFG
jgi:hypothetical protein